MASIVQQQPSNALSATATSAATVALVITLADPPAGQCIFIDSISYGFVGTTQTNNSWNIQTAGGGTSYMLGYAVGTAGLAFQHLPFPGSSLHGADGEQLEFSAAGLTNCEQRGTVTYHYQRTP